MRFSLRFILRLLLLTVLLSNLTFSQSLKKQPQPVFKRSGISEQHILKIDYFDRDKTTLHKMSAKADTLKILAIRVSFQPDTLETTTGDGTFVLAPNDTTIIDPPPHDRDYFLAQLDAVAHYYRTVSNKKLELTGEVYPLQNDSGYTLPHSMDYYHPGNSDMEDDVRLAELFRDAVSVANTQDQILFSQFDIFVVFHAGVGQDFANDFETTPNDIPSAFLNRSFLQKNLGNDDPNFPGIPTSDGFVTEGIVLPETQNQDGSEIAVKGTFVLYLGNQLGLPSLFDQENGRPGIGAWGLMDVGSSNYFGLIPAQPCAWTKVFMGWEEPVVLQPGTGLKIGVAISKSAPHIYKIPINSDEYFLIENRNRDFNEDQVTTGADQYDHRLEFNPFGNFTAQIDTTLGERLGVITKVFDYDFNIPGDGILVWHIDDRVIAENYVNNSINADIDHRGVDLEEADGSQDIGQNYGFLSPGSGSEFGVAEDAFFAGNEIHQIANKVDFVSFSSVSSPSSKSYSGGNSGITLKNFSPIDSVMSFDFLNTLRFANFPQRFAGTSEIKFPPTISENRIFFTPGNGYLFAWNAVGEALIQNDQWLTYQDWQRNQVNFLAAVFDTVNGSFTHPPLSADLNGDGQKEIIGVANQTKILIWSPEPDPNTNFATRLTHILTPAEKIMVSDGMLLSISAEKLHSFKFTADNIPQDNWSISFNSSVVDFCETLGSNSGKLWAVELANGEIKTISTAGQEVNQRNLSTTGSHFSLVSGFLENQSSPALVLSTDTQIFAFDNQLQPIQGFPVQINENIQSKAIVSDLDQDGFGEIVFTTTEKIYMLNHNGSLSSGFPIDLKNRFAERVSAWGAPLALLGDKTGYIFLKDGVNNVLTISSDGALLRDQIISSGGKTIAPFLCLADLNQDGLMELIDAGSDGLLNVRQLNLQNWQTEGSWLQTNFNDGGSKFNLTKIPGSMPGGSEFLRYAFNYPNPAENGQTTFRFYLIEDATVKIDIFDLAGEKITTLNSNALGQVENEIVWSVQNVESGIYMARLEASAENKMAHKMIKVAVVK